MDLKEIINRPNEAPIEENEACFIIKEYIKTRKGVEVNPIIETRLGNTYAMREVGLMNKMLDHAIEWFKENTN